MESKNEKIYFWKKRLYSHTRFNTNFGFNKNLERLMFGVLIAYGFNLLLKIFGNIAIINGFSPSLAIVGPSLVLIFVGYRMLKNQ